MYSQQYQDSDVLSAARRRVSQIFDLYQSIVVSVSGGKDSTVLAHMMLTEANRRGRQIGIFFLDEEVVYQSTVDQVEYLMSLYPENTNRVWVQTEFRLTNAVSTTEGQLVAWERGKHKIWMRKKSKNNIQGPPWGSDPTVRDKNKGFGFYDAIENFERQYHDTAFVVGLRATESPHRWFAVSKNPITRAGALIHWATNKGRDNAALYPLYDWNTHDVWKYIADHKVRYSSLYDWQFLKGLGIQEMRCSSLIHEKSFKSLQELPEFEPKTYQRLLKRIKGISFAQETGKDSKMFKVRKLPKNFSSWRDYRDFLLKTYPDRDKLPIFERRFTRHLDNEYVARQQCRQLVLNDYENNLPVTNKPDPRDELIAHYRSVL